MLFNRTRALNRVGGDGQLLDELVEAFVEDIPDQIGEMERALAGNDLIRVAKLAHTIKGSSGTVCAEDAHAAAFELEMAARQNKTDEIPALFDKFKAELSRFEGEMRCT